MTTTFPPLEVPTGPPSEMPSAVTHRLGLAERLICTVAGGALAAVGLRRGGLPGLVTALAGASLVVRGATGQPMGFTLPGLGLESGDESRRESVAPVHGAIKVSRVTTINAPAADLYAIWRQLETLPQVMSHLESVEVLDATRSHWTAKGPAGTSVEWDAEIFRDVEGEVIAWRSLPGAEVPNAGSVSFVEQPVGRGTEVRVELQYDPPGGRLGAFVAKLFGEDPDLQVREDLRKFKQRIEAGEVATGYRTAADAAKDK